MPLHKQADFARLCGISAAHLSVNKSRGKVIVVDKLIDDTNPINAEFLARCLERKGTEAAEPAPADQPVPEAKPTKTKKQRPATDKATTEKIAKEKTTLFELEKEQKELSIEKQRHELESAKIRSAKLKGEVLPTDQVKTLFQQHTKSITVAFKDAIDSLLVEIKAKARLSQNDLAELRARLVELLNSSVDRAAADTTDFLKNLQAEYSKVTNDRHS